MTSIFCATFRATQQLPRVCFDLQYKHCRMLWRKLCGLSCNIFINPLMIYKRFKLRKKDLFRYGIFHIFAKINSPYAKMGGYFTIPDPWNMSSLGTRAISKFCLWLHTMLYVLMVIIWCATSNYSSACPSSIIAKSFLI